MKYVLVSGGVASGIGKGIIASSTGLLLKSLGLKVTAIKIDPYLNVDAGTMGPLEHGEVFVLDDGGEVDLDLGNYERYLNITLARDNNITTGKIYQHVIQLERKGKYLGKTVQVVPHLTDAIQDWIERVAKISVDESGEQPDACIIELGGTVGDIESATFTEALRQLKRRAGKNNFLHMHVTWIVDIETEHKTKPTQRAVQDVGRAGIPPDIIVARSVLELNESVKNKVIFFSEVEPEQVFPVHNVASTYQVPSLLEELDLTRTLRMIMQLDELKISYSKRTQAQLAWNDWKSRTHPIKKTEQSIVKIALVGKYTNLHDSYLSVIKSCEHAAMACKKVLELIWVDSEDLEDSTATKGSATHQKAWESITTADGILVPGGFGLRGTEGMILAAQYARENKKPYLGICLGMQLAVIEYARNVCKISGAGSGEFEDSEKGILIENKLVIFMPEGDKENMGGTMRLGIRETHFQTGSEWSRLRALYSNSNSRRVILNGASNGDYKFSATSDSTAPIILERHRHRYEVNPEYIDQLSGAGLPFIGKDDTGKRMEIIELEDHPWYVGVQFHPEYLSRVLEPSKPYLGFIAASSGCLESMLDEMKASEVPQKVNGTAN